MNKSKKLISTSTLRNKTFVYKTIVLYIQMTHSYLLHNEEPQEGFPCNSNYSLKHVLIECVDFSDVRQTFYNVNNLADLFTNVNTILSFRKTSTLRNKTFVYKTIVLYIQIKEKLKG
jgi:hypothetical protein